jgi:hypothetical protein
VKKRRPDAVATLRVVKVRGKVFVFMGTPGEAFA